MVTVAVITEYNPFHTGHKYQIDRIRSEFGDDTEIIAIMSGNFTQRGDVAIADKFIRAECAVRCGADLVLEIPFPHSISSAELFAKAGVTIADKLRVIDYLSFGSESGDIEALSKTADNILGKEYEAELKKIIASPDYANIGFPKQREVAYTNLFGEMLPQTANNILAIEYIKALKLIKSKIKPHTIMRHGADYNSIKIEEMNHQSATAIRALLTASDNSAVNYMPKECIETILRAINNKEIPSDSSALDISVISHFRLNPTADKSIFDTAGGLYNRLYKASLNSTGISSLTESASTKKFTNARVRRAIWYSYFGVTSSEALTAPLYTQLLAMNERGACILKRSKKISDFPIVTKPSSYDFLDEDAKKQKEFSARADSVFELTKPRPRSAGHALSSTPYIKKNANS